MLVTVKTRHHSLCFILVGINVMGHFYFCSF